MCKLAGYYLTKKTKTAGDTAKAVLHDLLTLQEAGNTDATGMGMIVKGGFYAHKHNTNATDFLGHESTVALLREHNPRSIIAHCRLKTHGDASNPHNNHPNYTKSGILTIHNGVLTNHDQLFTDHGLSRDGEVDSEVVGKLIEKYKNENKTTPQAIQAMSELVRGSMDL